MLRCAVVGLGRFGIKVAENLMQQGAEVLAIDISEDLIETVKDKFTRSIILDATDEAALRSVGFQEMDVVIVGMGEHFEASVLIVALVRKLRVPRIIVKATTDLQGEILKLVGATEVVYPEDGEARRLARMLLEPNILDYLRITEKQSVIKVVAPKKFLGKTIAGLNMRQKFGVTVLEIARSEKGKDITYTMPGPDFEFAEGDRMVIIGNRDDMEKFRRNFGE